MIFLFQFCHAICRHMNSAARGGNTNHHPASSYLKHPKACLMHRRCAALYELCFRRWTLANEIGVSKTIGEILHSEFACTTYKLQQTSNLSPVLCRQKLGKLTPYFHISTPYIHRQVIFNSKADHRNLCCPAKHTVCMFHIDRISLST
jgi:hypothetical protein